MTPAGPNAPFFVDNEVIRLTKNGVWLSDDTEIDHQQTVKMFAKSLKRDDEGYFIQIGRETKRILVEDTAYFVTSVDGTPEAGFEVRLSDESRERLDSSTLAYRPGRLSCKIKGGSEEAKFLHSAYFDLLKDLEEDDSSYLIRVQGKKIILAAK